MAFALAFLISAGLLVQTARNVTRVDVGFDPQHLLTAAVSLDERRYQSEAATRQFYENLVADLAVRPGVAGAAAGSLVPFSGGGGGTEFFIEGQPDPSPAETPLAAINGVTSRYLDTMGKQVRSFLLAGLAPGVMLAWALGQAMQAFLVGVTPTDWQT